ncbi:hypothetical protein [Salinibacterium sp. SWN167]|uniref:hypothetical protein n=1 Tax=Salinibacterium sp. SWN167 TaxID=2792054 RepID=UPI0018CF7354|nr:hypothetical protein [Salinibacterium sp. SWN167]MBH0083875.1 hypothetical protein [Salinibacterium sp. SWN167]
MSIFAVSSDVVNPLMPQGFDILFSSMFVFVLLVNLAALVLVVTALVSISRHRHMLVGTELALWVAITVIATGLGAIAWFAIGRRKARDNSPEEALPVRD